MEVDHPTYSDDTTTTILKYAEKQLQPMLNGRVILSMMTVVPMHLGMFALVVYTSLLRGLKT